MSEEEEITPKRLGGAELKLIVPRSIAARWAVEINLSRPGAEVTVLAAALGLCWRRVHKRLPYRHDLLAYGDQVIDYLMSPEESGAEPVGLADIIRAGREAYTLIKLSLVDVEGAAGFSVPPTDRDGGMSRGGSGGTSSPSNEHGASDRVGSDA